MSLQGHEADPEPGFKTQEEQFLALQITEQQLTNAKLRLECLVLARSLSTSRNYHADINAILSEVLPLAQ